MSNTIITATRIYYDDNGVQKQLEYKLLSRICPLGTIYDISCCRCSDASEVYNGVSLDYVRALRIFNIIYGASVSPEHLICIIDDLYEEYNM